MSAMLGRTWNYITAAVSPESSSAIKWTPPKDVSVPGGDLPKGLASFLKSLVTQPDVERIIEDNIALVKAKLDEPGVRDSAVADCLLRMTVADLHGFDVGFARVHALKLAQKGETLSLKKIGYLTSVALLKESQDPLNLLLVNTIIKDLSSKNPIEINFALCASASHLIPDEVVPLLLPSLISKTTHIKDFIRKKALASLHSLLKRNPELASSIEGPTRRCLTDQNPGVVGIALQVTKELVGRVDVLDILPGVLEVADQIIEDKFSNEYKYKGLTAPWMLIDALSLVSSIIQSVEGQKISTDVNDSYFQLLRRILSKSSGSKEIISYATTFECIKAIYALRNTDQKSELFSKALQAVSKFLQDKSSNLKYIGIASMELLFTNTDLVLTAEQEQIISNCLNYPDESIRRKTLSLMYVLAHENNVRQICNRLLSYIKESDDKYKRKEFLEKASGLVDKFKESQGMDWYINVLLRLSQVSPSEMKHNFLYRIKSALGSQSTDDPAEQSKVGSKLKSILSRFLFGEEVKVSKSMTSLYIWCWSHFETDFEDFSSILDVAKKADTEESVLDALFYIFTHNPSVHFSDNIQTYIQNSSKHPNERIRDKARELDFMVQLLGKEILPEITSPHDFTLTSCDEFIYEQSMYRELIPYRNKCSLLLSEAVINSEEGEGKDKSKLRLTPYNELPSPSSSSKNSSSQLKDILHTSDAQVWSFSGCNRGSMSNKLSDSLESFFVEEKHQTFGLESLSKDDFAMTEEEE